MRKKYSNGILVRTCKKCKKQISDQSIREYCSECFEKVQAVFDKIDAYLKEYPGATAFEIEQETHIPYHVINNFVREGRLIEIPNEYLNMECKRCGCLLLSAHYEYCPGCREKIKKEMEWAKTQLRTHIDAKMHIKSRNKNR